MHLDLDIGNTRIKWRTNDRNGENFGHMQTNDWPGGLQLERTERVRISNVAGDSIARRVADSVAQAAGVSAEFAHSSSQCAGVTSGYDDPSRLGVDRWLAVLAAYQRVRGACCVVDCGSAITVDYVDSAGHHLGGLIAPGLSLMHRVLLEGTSDIHVDRPSLANRQKLPSGTTTEEAVARGLESMEVGLIELARRRFSEMTDESPHLVLTGGDAELISGLLDGAYALVPHLVLEGLAVAIP